MDRAYSDYLPHKLKGFYLDKRNAMIESLKRLPEADGAALEIGSGTGKNLRFIPAKMVVGLEPDLDMLAMNKPGLIVRGLGQRLPFASLAFIYSITITVLQHIYDLHIVRGLIAEASRVSRDAVYLLEDRPISDVIRSLLPNGWRLDQVERLHPSTPRGGGFDKITLIRSL